MATDFNTLKKAMLEALEKSLGIVTTAAKTAGIDRSTHYKWLDSDPEYKAAVERLADVALDFAESKLMKSIENGSDTAIIFYLKTKGKRRGYIERTDIGFQNEPIEIKVIRDAGNSQPKGIT